MIFGYWRIRISGLVCCAAIAAAGAACRSAETSPVAPGGDRSAETAIREVRVEEAREQSLARRVTAPGTLAADEQATVSFKVAGRLSQLRVDLGTLVREGQEIAQLETVDFRVRVDQSEAALQQARVRLGLPAEGDDDRIEMENTSLVRQARAVLDEARANRERTVRLVREQVLPEAELDRVDSAFKVAESRYQDAIEEVRNRQALLMQRRSELRIARQQLAETTLYAPFNGAIRERRASIGEYLTPGVPVATVVRLHPLRLRVEIPEREAHDLRTGQSVRVTVEGDSDVYSGRVVRLSPVFSEQSRSLVIEAEVDNKHGRLRPGSFAKAEILTTSRSNALMIPAAAVVTFAGIQKVYLVNDGKAHERSIVVGRREGDLLEVLEGLKSGERVVIAPGNMVTGQAVRILD